MTISSRVSLNYSFQMWAGSESNCFFMIQCRNSFLEVSKIYFTKFWWKNLRFTKYASLRKSSVSISHYEFSKIFQKTVTENGYSGCGEFFNITETWTQPICYQIVIKRSYCEKGWVQTFSRQVAISFPAGIYLLKVNNRNTRLRCEICSKLIKTPEQC